MEPLIINAAITGMVPQRHDSPHVPLTVPQILEDVGRCRDSGACIVHIHARDDEGRPTYRMEVYQEIIDGIRTRFPDLLISASCSGRVHRQFWQRSQVLDLHPDLGSLTLGSLNFPSQASVNSPEMIHGLADAMKQRGIMPELEVFDLGMAEYAHYLLGKGLIRPPLYANILLGSRGALRASAENLCLMIRALPQGTTWAATGIGRFQFFINSLSVAMGGHVRVGLEDALYYDWDTKRLATNAGLIDRVVGVAEAIGRPIATPQQTRAMLGFLRTVAASA